jgi:hypothetical protein
MRVSRVDAYEVTLAARLVSFTANWGAFIAIGAVNLQN